MFNSPSRTFKSLEVLKLSLDDQYLVLQGKSYTAIWNKIPAEVNLFNGT